MIKLLNFALLLTFIGVSAGTVAAKPASFTIKGKLKGLMDGRYVYLTHKWDDALHTDSTKVKGGEFTFKGTTPEPNMYWIYESPKSKDILIFFVDKGEISISGELKNLADAEVKAGKSQVDYSEYRLLLKSFEDQKTKMGLEFQQAQQAGDQVKMMDIQQSYNKLVEEQKAKIDEFIKGHTKSVVAGYAIWASVGNEPDLADIEKNYALLDQSVKDSKFGKIVEDKIASIKGTQIGNKILDFSQNDADGNPVKISSFKGKVVLVDFWASWCGPCRAENPNVVRAYNAFKDKGFDILGVSFDSAKDKWLGAVEKDKLTWTHVSDLKGWGNEVGQKFGIRSIPQNLLIDKNGVIIAKNLRGEQLYSKLEELFKE